jgi:hypothetical protein
MSHHHGFLVEEPHGGKSKTPSYWFSRLINKFSYPDKLGPSSTLQVPEHRFSGGTISPERLYVSPARDLPKTFLKDMLVYQFPTVLPFPNDIGSPNECSFSLKKAPNPAQLSGAELERCTDE